MFIEKLRREKKWDIARCFKFIDRFIDDVNAKNNKGTFNKYKDTIYSKGLEVSKENVGILHTTMLEIDMTIVDGKFVTKLYDKRDDFTFEIVKYPSMLSNIHSKTVYNVFTSQFVRYSRVCNKLDHLIFCTSKLLKLLILKGCKRSRLLHILRKLLHKHKLVNKFNIIDINVHFLTRL